MEEIRKRTRTETDLIAELDTEHSKFFFLALVLAFPDKAALILPYHEDSMQTLRGALAAGAAPIGLAGVILESPTTALFYTRAFAEIANDVRVTGYLEKQMQAVAHAAKLAPTVTSMEQRSGWPQGGRIFVLQRAMRARQNGEFDGDGRQ